MKDEEIEKLLADAQNSGMSGATWWEMIDALRHLHDEVKALREDKRRLDSLEDYLEIHFSEYVDGTKAVNILGDEFTGKTNREAIDAALQQEDK